MMRLFLVCTALILHSFSAHAFNIFEEAQKAGLLQPEPHPLSRPLSSPLSDNETWIGIVGDSSTTGAFASPMMQATWLTVLNQVLDLTNDDRMISLRPRIKDYPNAAKFKISEPIQPLERVLYTRGEFDTADKKNLAIEFELGAQASLRLNTSEYTFGYMLGKYWNLPEDHIVLAGQDGATVSALSTQFSRLFETGATRLPPLVLVSFVANDLCGPETVAGTPEAFGQKYSQILSQQMHEIATYPTSAKGTRIVFLAPLDIASLWANPNLAKQKVPFEPFAPVACRDLRNPKVASTDPAKLMQDLLVGECRGLLEPTSDPAGRVQKVRELQKVQLSALKDAIKELNALNPSIHAEVATSVRKLDFQTGDVANDCFHPSVRGHSRIAEKLLQAELKHGL